MGYLISFVVKTCSRSIQTEYLVSTQNFCYSVFLPKVESLILQRYSSKKTRHYSKQRKLLVIEVNVLSIFLDLGNNITFCNNEKGFYRTRRMFWTEHTLSLLYLLCHKFFHFYIFLGVNILHFLILMLSKRLLEINLKAGIPLTSVGMGLITECIHGVSHTSITVR